AGPVVFYGNMDASLEAVGPDPKITTMRKTPPKGDANVVDSAALAVVCGKIHAQRMFGSLRHELLTYWVIDSIVPAEMQPRIIIAIIWFAFPIARQSDRVGCFVETSIADQFCGQSALHAFEHEFIELAIKHRAYLTLDPIRIDINASRK